MVLSDFKLFGPIETTPNTQQFSSDDKMKYATGIWLLKQERLAPTSRGHVFSVKGKNAD